MCRLKILMIPLCFLLSFDLIGQTQNANENEIFRLKTVIEEQNDWVQIYPNPSFGEVTLISELNASVFIVGETGNYIENLNLTENEAQQINLPKGNYIVNVKSGDRIIPKRIIVN
jgi:hypothetical protein